ncbi:MAG: hypothetical protein SOV55_01225 [Candidatus Borkfalkiaceae bacterium]|nr:hypothetical protein [Christensenellaceae bacterium]
MSKKIICLFLSLITAISLVFFSSCGGDNSSKESDMSSSSSSSGGENEKNNDFDFLCGISEPYATSTVKGFNYEVASELVGAIGAESFRMWMSLGTLYDGFNNGVVLSDEKLSEVSEFGKQLYGSYIESLASTSVKEIIGCGCFLPKVTSTAKYNSDKPYVPERSLSENSEYAEFLNKVYIIFKAVAKAFPEITVWEMGNEYNSNTFMTTPGRELSQSELADIYVDYMYFASKGIKEGNPEAIAIPAGFAPVGGIQSVQSFYELIYDAIDSGNYPSIGEKATSYRDYFDGLCWNPYDGDNAVVVLGDGTNLNLDLWKKRNDDVYNVAVSHGDRGLKVWFTEFGYTLGEGNLIPSSAADSSITRYNVSGTYYDLNPASEEWVCNYSRAYLEKMKEMDYLHTLGYFRLFCSIRGADWNGFGEVYFGMFLEPDETVNRGFYPRKNAYAIRKLFGGKGDLTKYSSFESL